MRRRALTAALLSFAALVLATGASFVWIYHAVADAAGTGGCGGG